jgi:hypothetical protein
MVTDTVLTFTGSWKLHSIGVYMAHFAKLGTGNIVEKVEL